MFSLNLIILLKLDQVIGVTLNFRQYIYVGFPFLYFENGE